MRLRSISGVTSSCSISLNVGIVICIVSSVSVRPVNKIAKKKKKKYAIPKNPNPHLIFLVSYTFLLYQNCQFLVRRFSHRGCLHQFTSNAHCSPSVRHPTSASRATLGRPSTYLYYSKPKMEAAV